MGDKLVYTVTVEKVPQNTGCLIMLVPLLLAALAGTVWAMF